MTRVYGIVGDPIAQARSPEVFNARFRAAGLDAVMVPMHVSAEAIEPAFRGLRALHNLAGLVITVPHKPAAARLLLSGSDRVRIAGAANVLRPVEGGWAGDLFDGEGFALGLAANGIELRAARCALVGAGGAGSAIALALLERDVAGLTILDVDRAKASSLAERLRGVTAIPVALAAPDASSDLVINATPLGMQADDPLPIDLDTLRQGTIVADAIMKPPITPLLQEAARRGFRIQEGRHMLDHQVDAIWRFFGLP